MGKKAQKVIHKYLRHNKNFPHMWCAGCSHGTVLGSLIRAIDSLNIERDNIAMVSGIGCSSRMPVYVDFNTLHSIHGRAIPFATGIKMFKPNMKVIVITGDGDATAIGGNHFIHAARRNIDLTVLVLNNNIYGMTGGQFSPTTPNQDLATTSPHGNIDLPFDICKLALGAGASFVGRTTAAHVNDCEKMIAQAIDHDGLAILDILSTCPTSYGRMNKKGTPAKMMRQLVNETVLNKAAEKLPKEKVEGKIIRGIFRKEDKAEYTKEYAKLVEKLKK